jgi:hypothetical protein
LLSALLLLPKPIRELRRTAAGDLSFTAGAYAVTSIGVDVGRIADDHVELRPTQLVLANRDGASKTIDVAERMAQIGALWQAAEGGTSTLASLLTSHRDAVLESPGDHVRLESLRTGILRQLKARADPVQAAAGALGVALPAPLGPGDTEEADGTRAQIQLADEEDDTTPLEARRKQVRKWRLMATRDAKATRFRKDVRAAYRDTCLFTGLHLPRMPLTGSAGVDAAHILPWATHAIDDVTNGICVSKLCHWAFDEGVVQLSYVNDSHAYGIAIPESVRKVASRLSFDLSCFAPLEGLIPRSTLPHDAKLWPNRKFLDAYNKVMFEE